MKKKLRSGCSASFYNDFCTRSGRRDGCTSICQGSDINSHIFKRRQLSNGWAVQKHPHLLLKVTHEQTVDQCWLFKNRIKSSGKKDRRPASSTTTSTPLVFERLNSTYLTIGCYIKSLSQEQLHSNNKPHKVDFLVDCFFVSHSLV